MTAGTKKSSTESHNQLAIQQALSLCQRHRHPVTLLAMDVADQDNLRADIGEARMETLVSLIAEHLQHYKRCEDLLIINPDSRVMLVVLPATDIHGGHHLASRLLSQFAGEAFQLDEFQIELSLRIALHGCEVVEDTDPEALINATLQLLETPNQGDYLLLSDHARTQLDMPASQARDALANTLVTRASSQRTRRELLDSLKPALSCLPESERMQLVDHLLDLSTRLDSGLASH